MSSQLQDKEIVDLKDFARRAFEALGGVIEERGPDALEVLVPEERTSYFGGQDIFTLSFLPEPMAPIKRGIFFAVGSPALESLVQLISDKGCPAKAYVNPLHLGTGNLEEKLARSLHFDGAKAYLKSQSQEETANAVFHFKVSFLTDDKTERLYPVAVNLTTSLVNERLIRQWDRLFWDHGPSYQDIPFFDLPCLEKAYEKAREGLRESLRPDLEKIQTTQEKFLKRELFRMQAYYGHLLAELDRKEIKAQGQGALLEKIQSRRKAIDLDRKKKWEDAQEKHRIEVRASVVNLLILYQPWLRCVFGFRTREGAIEQTFYWDPVFKDFSEHPCELCGAPSSLFAVKNQKLICVKCQKK